jgi:hypothetical protein
MKNGLIALAFTFITTLSFAHDEGHGPKLTDTPKRGGVISPVIDSKEADKGAKAAVIYKAELVRTKDGNVNVYLYDKEMKDLDLTKFDKAAKALVEVTKKKKTTKTDFKLELKDDDGEKSFAGKAPKPSSKPFNIDVRVTEAGKELLVAFDNLD